MLYTFKKKKPAKLANRQISRQFGWTPDKGSPPRGAMEIRRFQEPADDDLHHIELPHHEIYKVVAHHADNTKLFDWRKRSPLLAFSIYQRVA